jgi:NAD(P)-dependent dehydrogenase (short-subunit alcohol dehydrogenase family)
MATVLVTGANRGIGLEFCRQLAARGDEVIAVCRNAGDELPHLGVRVIDGIDVAEQSDIDGLVEELDGLKLDVLINNAGILIRDTLSTFLYSDIVKQLKINTLGPLHVTASLLQNLAEGSKVVTITSSMGSIAENTSGGYYGYRISKTAVNMAMKSLSVDLQGRGIAVFVLHPGYVATDMTDHQGPVSASDSVKGMLARIDELGLADTGTFHHAQGREIPW